jgi:ribosomal protein S18 acetylase RimI-like enzyme
MDRAGAASLDIVPLTPSRVADYLAFFDGVAFADNPEWAKCYCHYYHVPKTIPWQSFDAAANRTAMKARIDVGEMDGFLAYRGGVVVGWLNAQPLSKLPHCWARMGVERPQLHVPDTDAAAIVCFVIAPGERRRGVARALLGGALKLMRERGIRCVFAFPFEARDDARATAHYHGPRPLFDAEGFVPVTATQDLTLVRKDLDAP